MHPKARNFDTWRSYKTQRSTPCIVHVRKCEPVNKVIKNRRRERSSAMPLCRARAVFFSLVYMVVSRVLSWMMWLVKIDVLTQNVITVFLVQFDIFLPEISVNLSFNSIHGITKYIVDMFTQKQCNYSYSKN